MTRVLTIIHTILAAFFLPMGLLYAITGGLYTANIKGAYNTTEETVAIEGTLPQDLSALVRIVEAELEMRNLETPTGSAGIKKGGTSFFLEWTGTRRDIELHPTANPGEAILKIKETSPHRFFVQLHKAKGGPAFKVFAVVWMVGLVLLFVTGGIMAFSIKRFRPIAAVSASLGIVVFVALAYLS